MPAVDLYIDSEEERRIFLARIVDLERELMRAQRTERVLHETEQRYLTLMDSGVFLYMILSPSGMFRMMNRRAEKFLGFRLRFGMEVTLQSLSGPGYTGELESVLRDALRKATRITLPVVRGEGTLGWLNMELSCTRWQGTPVLQAIASDVTELIQVRTEPPGPGDYGPVCALQMLSSCPGLLCFAVDRNGVLLYATRGYREVARRFLGHECAPGLPYPAGLVTAFDMELHELTEEAYNGNTGMTTLVEKGEGTGNRWNVTVAPLLSSQGNVVGAVAHLTSLLQERVRDVGQAGVSRLGLQIEMLNVIPKMCVVLDEKGQCIEANSCFLETLKLAREEVVGNKFSALATALGLKPAMGGDSPGDLNDGVLQMVRGGRSDALECRICTRDGEVLCLELRGVPVTWDACAATLVSCTDVTRLRRTEEQLERVSTMDGLTGILNRRGMERVLATEVEGALRRRASLSLLVFDVDEFKILNERLGYAAGDDVLRALAAIFRSRVHSADFLGRWGGDEFMVLTPSSMNEASRLAEQLLTVAEQRIFGEDMRLTLSAGIAELQEGMDSSALVAAACDAMTEAKREGGNRSLQARADELVFAGSTPGDG
ncbi:MAG: diguanylate cyclase [Synergistaceae bacterium]|nr:diguanylate cyclase [Synergistaceae bacterium]